jgi:hypothetical protein
MPTILIELSRKYFDELGDSITRGNLLMAIKKKVQQEVHQCQDCLTVYNSEYGDLVQGIEKEYCFRIYLKIIVVVLYAILQEIMNRMGLILQ